MLNIFLEKCVFCYIILKLIVLTHLPFGIRSKKKNKKTKTKTVGQKGKTVKYVRHTFRRRRRRKRRKREEYRLISSPEEEEEEEEPEQIGVRD